MILGEEVDEEVAKMFNPGSVNGIRVCRKAGCMFGRAWQRWGGRTQRHVLVESFLVVYLSVSSLSLIDAQKAVPLPTRGW